MNAWFAVLIACATLSVTSSLSVIATLVCFKRMRNQFFMQLIAFISLGDLIGNFPYLFPYRPNSGWWCSMQAFMNLSGYPIAWLWTVSLVYFLYKMSMTGQLPSSSEVLGMHVICWTVPLSLAALVRTVSKYTREVHDLQICTGNRTPTSHWYHVFAYYGLFYCCLFTMLALLLQIYRAERRGDPCVTSNAFKVAKTALQWYPFIYIIFWLPHSLSSIIFFDGDLGENVYRTGLIWRVLHGVVTANVFFTQSSEARRLWWSATIGHFTVEGDEVHLAPVESIIDRNTDISSVGISFVIINPIVRKEIIAEVTSLPSPAV